MLQKLHATEEHDVDMYTIVRTKMELTVFML